MPKRKTFGFLGLALLGLGFYYFRRQLLRRLLDLSPVRYLVKIQRDLVVTTPDDIDLRTDLYSPVGGRLFPTLLIRTPYGRSARVTASGVLPAFIAQRFAERGYNVVVQDVRGRFDSTGKFEPFRNETKDGRATLAWLEKQSWFNGVLGMWGPSYLGYVQWAIASGAPLYLKALMPVISGSQIPISGFRDGTLAVDTLFRWIMDLDTMDRMHKPLGLFNLSRFTSYVQDRMITHAAGRLPLMIADREIVGREVDFYQEWLAHPSLEDPYWTALGGREDLGSLTASVHLVSGWYDILLRETLADYAVLHSAGRTPYLTIGPWSHIDTECIWESLRQGIAWFDAHLKGDRRGLRKAPVRLFVMGEKKWRNLDAWPPPARDTFYYLDSSQANNTAAQNRRFGGAPPSGVLSDEVPAGDSPPSTYTYDPSDPTPSVGGPLMSLHAGQVDNRKLEARKDVLIFTTAPIETDIEVIGAPRLVLYVASSSAYTDFFGRLCDVYPDGKSINICDGMLHLQPGRGEVQPDGSLRIQIDLWGTAYRFAKGHCLRLQISSGAHPRWTRNLGMGEPVATAVQMVAAQQTVYHDAAHPSNLILPVTNP